MERMNNFKKEISQEELNAMTTVSFDGSIWVVEDPSAMDEIMDRLINWDVIGFDTETRPTFRKGKMNKVSLLQLSVDHEVYLIRIRKTGFPDKLKEIFENPEIVKTGVAIRDDIKKLNELRPFKAEGFVELQDYSCHFGIESNSLRKLAAIVLGFRISKSQQTSNWEAPRLDDSQIKYAAMDAWASREIYLKLRNSAIVK